MRQNLPMSSTAPRVKTEKPPLSNITLCPMRRHVAKSCGATKTHAKHAPSHSHKLRAWRYRGAVVVQHYGFAPGFSGYSTARACASHAYTARQWSGSQK